MLRSTRSATIHPSTRDRVCSNAAAARCSSAASSIDSVATSTPRSNACSMPPGRGRHDSSYMRSLNRSTASRSPKQKPRRPMARTCTLVPESQLAPPKQPHLLKTQLRQQGPQPNSGRQAHHSTCHQGEQARTQTAVCSPQEELSLPPSPRKSSSPRQDSPEVAPADVTPAAVENNNVQCGPVTDCNASSGYPTSIPAGGCAIEPHWNMIAADGSLLLTRAASATVQPVLVPGVFWTPGPCASFSYGPVPTMHSFNHQGQRFQGSAEWLGAPSVGEGPMVADGSRLAAPSATAAQQSPTEVVAFDQDAAKTIGIRNVATEKPRSTGVLDWLEGGWRLLRGGLFGQVDLIPFCNSGITGDDGTEQLSIGELQRQPLAAQDCRAMSVLDTDGTPRDWDSNWEMTCH